MDLSKINDRGGKKWTSMMLIEHKESLRKLEDELLNDVEKPILDQDKLEEFDMILNQGMMGGKLIKFWVYKRKRIEILEGYIRKTRPVEGIIQVRTRDGLPEILYIESIIDMQILE